MEQATCQAAHIPVLYAEVLDWMQPRASGQYIDSTLGLGGHARGLLERSTPDGRLLGLDRDPQALEHARKSLAVFGERALLVHGDFGDLLRLARAQGFSAVDGILFDLGVSSLQLDNAQRGFSFREAGPLDMRMNTQGELTAADIVNTWPEAELARVLWEYGEERRSRQIARAICQRRPLHTTQELATVVSAIAGHSGWIHPATRTFQALRIAVNCELQALETALPQAVQLLKPGGRLLVIAFHSLEDRIVKQFMARESTDCVCSPTMPLCRCGHHASLKRLTKKPLGASEEEIQRNPRSRSARLRVAERLDTAFSHSDSLRE